MKSQALRLLEGGPKDFLTKYWVSPSAQYSRYKLPDANATVPAFFGRQNVFHGNKDQVDSQLTIVNYGDKIAYSQLIEGGGDSYALHCYHPRQLTDPQKADMLPIWYLPWWEDHVTKMKIHSTAHIPEGPRNPRIFFTTALTGCTIFVKGPADAPTVYHGGFDSNRDYTAAPKLDPNSMQHWRILFDRYSPNTPNRGEANKGQYMADLTDSPDLQVYLNYLKTTAQGHVMIRNLIGEGNVFGIRADNGNWTFYLQEVVTVQYQTFRIKKKLIGKDQRIESAVQNYRRPMCLREIYPNGNGQARTWNLEPVRV